MSNQDLEELLECLNQPPRIYTLEYGQKSTAETGTLQSSSNPLLPVELPAEQESYQSSNEMSHTKTDHNQVVIPTLERILELVQKGAKTVQSPDFDERLATYSYLDAEHSVGCLTELYRKHIEQLANNLTICKDELASKEYESQQQLNAAVLSERERLNEEHNHEIEIRQNEHKRHCEEIETKYGNEKKALQDQVCELMKEYNTLQSQVIELNLDALTLQTRVSTLDSEKNALQLQLSELQSEKGALQAQVLELNSRNTELVSDIGQIKQTFEEKSAQLMRDMESNMKSLERNHCKEISGLQRENEVLKEALLTRVYNKAFLDHEVSSNFRNMSIQILDTALDADQAAVFKESVRPLPKEGHISRSVILKRCALCKMLKFAPESQSNKLETTAVIINEFSKQFNEMPCCHNAICAECLSKTLLASIRNDWWCNLESANWFRCPIATCLQIMPIRHSNELAKILTELGIRDVDAQLQIYELTRILRNALQDLDPKPSPEALTIACGIHQQLVEKGRMYEFFDSRFQSSIPDDDGRLQPFKPGKILLCDVDQGNLTVPIFTKFFCRRAASRECAVCTESFFEINFETEQEWLLSCEGFSGPWIWKVLLFPSKATLKCEHEINVCKVCWAKHLKSQLEQYGRDGCNKLSCPECSRILSFEEIRLYAPKDTLNQYEHFCTLKFLSAEENFRWCLKESCSNGQLYEDMDFLDPRIECNECHFEMCFTHQIPWHEDYTCEQYDNQREHGDPDVIKTQQYLASNTKRCPGPCCGLNIEKDEGCFHMTCPGCGHQFCWECLADWTTISDRGQNGHNDGCWFRTGILPPTAIDGNNLMEALQSLGLAA